MGDQLPPAEGIYRRHAAGEPLRPGGALPDHCVAFLRAADPTAARCWAVQQQQHPAALDPSDDAAAPHLTARAKQLWYWLRPPLVLVACAFTQSMLLHSATASYVADMEVFNAQLAELPPGADGAAGGRAGRVRRGMLYDVLGEAVGDRQVISLGMLDLSGLVPMLLFFFGALALRQQSFVIGLWTKTFLLAATLCLVKGVFDAVTIIPSSDGWDACVERLGDARFDIVKAGG
jgi:hypothetical protein